MKQEGTQLLLTKLFLTLGAITGTTTHVLQEIDLIVDIGLKVVSIISFTIVIVINWPKFIERLKELKNPSE